MTPRDDELTPFERELQGAGASEGRGHAPNDDIPEPSVAPSEPASPSAGASREPLPPPPLTPSDGADRTA
jgi:hypothetical protein